eukprot:jgi/Mesen1/1423/ME001303S00469
MRGLSPRDEPASFELATRRGSTQGLDDDEDGDALEATPASRLTAGELDELPLGLERWRGAVENLKDAAGGIDTLGQLLMGTAVYLDETPFQQASENAAQARTSKAQERRIRVLEREVDAAVAASAHLQAETRQAQRQQRRAEERARQLHDALDAQQKEAREWQAEVQKRDAEIAVLQAIIRTLSEKAPAVRPGQRSLS